MIIHEAPETPSGPHQGASFRVEKFSDIVTELPPLFYQHWRDVALEQDRIPLEPNWQLYYELEAAGLLVVYTVRVDGKLAGYYFCRVSQALHYKSSRQAFQDIYLITEAAKGSFPKLMDFVETDLKSRGVQKTYIMRKLHTPKGEAHDRLLRSMGYRPIEVWYSKMLED